MSGHTSEASWPRGRGQRRLLCSAVALMGACPHCTRKHQQERRDGKPGHQRVWASAHTHPHFVLEGGPFLEVVLLPPISETRQRRFGKLKLAPPVRGATPFTGSTQVKHELQNCSENPYGHLAMGRHRDDDDRGTIIQGIANVYRHGFVLRCPLLNASHGFPHFILVWVELCPPKKRSVEVLASNNSECDRIWRHSHYGYN